MSSPWPENLYRRLLFMPPPEPFECPNGTIIDTGCIEFTGARNEKGYGRIGIAGSVRYAHRAAYELLVGPIPDGLEIDHLCRNPPCVNVGHMELVTHAENGRRGAAGALQVRKTHCPQGHPYDEENTYVWNGWRSCRRCDRDRKMARRQIADEANGEDNA